MFIEQRLKINVMSWGFRIWLRIKYCRIFVVDGVLLFFSSVYEHSKILIVALSQRAPRDIEQLGCVIETMNNFITAGTIV